MKMGVSDAVVCVSDRDPDTAEPQHVGAGGGGDDAVPHDPRPVDAAPG